MIPHGSSRNKIIVGILIVFFAVVVGAWLLLSATGPVHFGFSSRENTGPLLFTPEEKEWIHEHPDIRVCPDPDYPPFEFYDATGNYAGISADYLSLIAKKTGLNITVVRASDWKECIQMIRTDKADLLGAVYISDLRTGYLNYSYPIYQMPLVIITNSSVPPGLTLERLNGSTVAVVDGYTSYELLIENYPGIHVLPEPNIRTGLRDVAFGRADAFFGDLGSASWAANKNELANLHVAGEYQPADPSSYQLAFGVRKDEPELTAILDKGLSLVTPEESGQITRTWIPTTLMSSELDFRIYLALLAGVIILVIVIGIVFAWNRALRRAVSRKTQELSLELDERKKAQESLCESEQKYRSILENIDDVFFRSDNNGRLVMMSPSGAALLGYTSTDELVGARVDEILYENPEDRRVFLAELQEKGSIRDYEQTLRRRDGTTVRVSATSQYYDGPDGQIAGIEGILRDITRRKQAEEALVMKNKELVFAQQKIAAGEAELRKNYGELHKSKQALEQARKKLNLLNAVLFQDIRSGVFSLYGYLELEKTLVTDPKVLSYLDKQIALVKSITRALSFSDTYQGLGLTPASWQNVGQAFVYGISHLDTSHLSWKYDVQGLEIFADSLLEQVFMILVENVLRQGQSVTTIRLSCHGAGDGLIIVFEDNGRGVPADLKEKIFERTNKDEQNPGFFLAREILSVTGISLRETGTFGKGARFEIVVPKGAFRFVSQP
jgi:PAS domain S-box-containing protein